MSFLKAEWRKLILANYEIEPGILRPFLPHKTELDVWQGTHYVSLVGFMFKNTRMLGLKIPWHVNFEEVNLRFYVKYKEAGEWKRGVVFIREFVPRPALSFVANKLYQEHYETVPMKHEWRFREEEQLIAYHWQKGGLRQKVEVSAGLLPQEIDPGSEEEFITEHYWGYTRVHAGKTFEYQVTHPRWQSYPVRKYEIEVDFGRIYGAPFRELNEGALKSIMLMEGSEITVENKRRL